MSNVEQNNFSRAEKAARIRELKRLLSSPAFSRESISGMRNAGEILFHRQAREAELRQLLEASPQ
jgi:hypothetical protein